MLAKRPLLLLPLLLFTASLSAQEISSDLLYTLSTDVPVYEVEFSPYGNFLAVADYDGGLHVFNRDFEKLWYRPGPDYTTNNPQALSWLSVVRFSTDEEQILVSNFGGSGSLGVLHTRTGEVVSRVSARRFLFSGLDVRAHDGVVATGVENELALWRWTGNELEEIDRIPVERPDGRSGNIYIQHLLFSSDGTRLYAAGLGSILAFDVSADRLVYLDYAQPDDHDDFPGYHNQMAISEDGRTLLATNDNNGADVWRIDGDEFVRLDAVGRRDAHGVEIRGNEGPVFTISRESIGVYTWHGNGYELQRTFLPGRRYLDFDISPDGRYLAAGTPLFAAGSPDWTRAQPFLPVWQLSGVQATAEGAVASAVGGRLSSLQKRLLAGAASRELWESVDPALREPQDMFETAEEFAERQRRLSSAVARAIYSLTEASFAAEVVGENRLEATMTVAPSDRGAYDIDTETYVLPVFGVDARIQLGRDAARDLYHNWGDARIRFRRARTTAGYLYHGYMLEHPTDGTLYPVTLEEDPFTGDRIDPVASRRPMSRVGEDLVLEELSIEGVFPTLYRHYADNPLGSVRVVNAGRRSVDDVRVGLEIPPFGSGPRYSELEETLAIGESRVLDLFALFGPELLQLDQTETRDARLLVSYRAGGERYSEELTVPATVMYRNAIRWSDDRKVASFMPVTGRTTIDFAASVAALVDDPASRALPRALLQSMRMFEALRALGLRYVVDPRSAYEELSADGYALDYLRFPAETLALGAGDCDDLSVLYNTLLESIGINTAFITTPGHIFAAFDLGIEQEQALRYMPSPEELIIRDGIVWVPVETTLIDAGFSAAWRRGALQWREAHRHGTAGFFTTQEAKRLYEAAPVPDVPSAPAVPARSTVDAFNNAFDRFRLEARQAGEEELVARIQRNPNPRDLTRLGILYARYNYLDEAQEQFERAFEFVNNDEDGHLPAVLNLANLLTLRGRLDEALGHLRRADSKWPRHPRVKLGLAATYLERGNRRSAEQAFADLAEIDPDLAQRFPLFGAPTVVDPGSESGTARASGEDSVREYLLDGWVVE